MIIFCFLAILFGLFSVYASDMQEYVQEINAVLPADQQYPELSAFFSNPKSLETLIKLQATPTNIKALTAIYNQVYDACLATRALADGVKPHKQLKTEECKRIFDKNDYCGRLKSLYFDPVGLNPDNPIKYDEYVEQVRTVIKILNSAKEAEAKEKKGIFKHLYTPGQFAEALVTVLKNHLGGLTFAEDPELVAKLKKACDVKGKPGDKTDKPADGKDKSDDGKDKTNDGKNPDDPNLGNKDKPWTLGKKIGAGIGIGGIIIVIIVIIIVIIKRKK
jgi:hypothetical protein